MLKHLLSCTLLALILAAFTASAAEKIFGPKGYKFTVDVPDNWSATALEDGVNMASRDGLNTLAIVIASMQGKPLGDIAKKTAQASGFSKVEALEENWLIEGKAGDRDCNIVLMPLDKDKYMLATIMAVDLDAAMEVFFTTDIDVPGGN